MVGPLNGTALVPGFGDPVRDAQAVFRAVMDALARPGPPRALPAGLPRPPGPLAPELGAIALALADHEAPLWLDAPLAAVVLAGFLPAYLIWRWFRRRSMEAYRGTRGAIAKIIVQIVESMNGIRAVQAFRRQPRNEQIMTGLNAQYRDANT
ncbi:MAG: phosphonate C-P lyase system protein PhnH, partial [Acetobacteraceae bacterium]|nr:phosphonate C-P lyase system protein PhnH [Acetobacteraceae bacterium]